MLRQRSISAIGIVLFAAIPAFVGGYLFAVAMLIIGVIGIHEMTQALTSAGYRPFAWLSLMAGSAFLIVAAFNSSNDALAWLVLLFLLLTLTAVVVLGQTEGTIVNWSLCCGAVLYVAVPLFFAIALRATKGDSSQNWSTTVAGSFGTPALGLAWVGLVISVTWLNDTAAYLIGRQFGRTKLVPRISPGKTRVGAVAGLFAGMLTGVLAAWLFGVPIAFWVAGGVGLVLALAGQIGDLAESVIKRSLGIKDMGTLIPGHGGVLDRVDALLFTFPVAFLLLHALTRIGWT